MVHAQPDAGVEAAIIPFGPWHPDASSVNAKVCVDANNCLPSISGFVPLMRPQPASSALAAAAQGAVAILKDDGSVATYAGTQSGLYQLTPTASWSDVSRLSGGAYNCATGEQWKFTLYGNNLLATNIADDLQVIDVTAGSHFVAVAGSPPRARYIDVVRDFVLLGAIAGNEKRVQWSANNDLTGWTAGVNESDYQDFPNGGPVKGVIGGETAYVLQTNKVTRMTYVPGGQQGLVFQFDEIEGSAGIVAAHSLVKLRSDAFYLSRDGFRRLSLVGANSVPIGQNKWVKWFLDDVRSGVEGGTIGVANPVRPIILWAYISKTNTTNTPNRVLIYDWSLDEATYADLSVETLLQWLSPGVTIDTMNSFGSLEELPFSLDSPFWRGGAAVMGLIGSDHKLAVQSGQTLPARWVTNDGMVQGRALVTGTRPVIDTTAATVALAGREANGDAVVFGSDEAMADTGYCPAFTSGNLIRARIKVPANENWTQIGGIETTAKGRGRR